MSHIWINNPFDNLVEEGARPQRYTMLSAELARAGHDVTWWTSDFSHLRKAVRRSSNGEELPSSYINASGVRMRLLKMRPYHSNTGLARILSHRLYAEEWRMTATREIISGSIPKPEIILTSLPPLATHRVARHMKREFNVKLLTDVQDAWPEAFKGLILGPECFKHMVWKILFCSAIRAAADAYAASDIITATGQSYIEMARRFNTSAPARQFRLGIDSISTSPPDIRKLGSPLRIVYSGNMGCSYDLKTLIRAVEMLAQKHKISLTLAGTGPDETALRKFASGKECVTFRGFLTNKELKELFVTSHIGVIPMFPRSMVAVPNKLADYTAAGLATVSSLPGETAELLARYDAGTQYSAGDANSLVKALLDTASTPNRLQAQRINALRLARENFLNSLIYPAMCRFIFDGAKKPEQNNS